MNMNELKRATDGKMGAITLVKAYFGATMNEMKDLPAKDRVELASAIVRAEKVEPPYGFELVEY